MENTLRRSSRTNLGIPPRRFGVSSLDGLIARENVRESLRENFGDGGGDSAIIENRPSTSMNISATQRLSNRREEIPSISRQHSNLEQTEIGRNELLKLEIEKQRKQIEMEMMIKEKELEMDILIKKKEMEFEMLVKKQELFEMERTFSVRSAESKRGSHKSESLYLVADEELDRKSIVENWVDDTKRQAAYGYSMIPEYENVTDLSVNKENVTETLVSCMENLNINLERLANKNSTNLQHFHGAIHEFPFWLAEYNRTTKEKHISQAENLSRLQFCLKGKARDVVKDLFCSADNVDAIIDTLKMYFGKCDWIIIDLMEKAKRCPNPKDDIVETYMQFSITVSNMVVSMIHTGSIKYLDNPDLLMKLEDKLPRNSRRAWAQIKVHKEFEKREVNLKDFSDWLKSEVNLLMSVSTSSQINTCHKSFERKEKVLSVIQKTPEKCKLCPNETHKLYNCKNFLEKPIADRREFVRENKLCYKCLNAGHVVSKCISKTYCNIDQCKGKHNRLLHPKRDTSSCTSKNNYPDDSPNPDDSPVLAVREMKAAVENSSEFLGCVSEKTSTILKVIKVKLFGEKDSVETYALLDEGSTVTLIDESIANKIKLDGPVVPICLQWTNQITHNEENSRMVNFHISGINEKNSYLVKNARVINNLMLPRQKIDPNYLCNKYKYLDKRILESVKNVRPKILIGQDNIFVMISHETVHPRFDQPVFSRTKLGWVVHGPYDIENGNECKIHHVNMCYHDEDYMTKMIEENFRIENSVSTISAKVSREDKRAEDIFQKTIKRQGERFEIGLPWKDENTILPESKMTAFRRLKCMEKKMDKDSDFAEQYCNKIKEYERKGYCEKLPRIECEMDGGRTWYLPHFGVKNVNKPGKFRFVFDAAAQSHGVSLNNFLLKGPDYYPLLTSILLRFRERRYAFCGDVKDMFHQVLIREEDRSCQRFLFRGMDRNRDPDIYQMRVMIFGAVCSPSIAQYVKNHNANEFSEEFPDIMRIMLDQHYVDDYLDSKDHLPEVIKTIKNVIEVHRRGGFQMVNWLSNSAEALKAIPSDYLAENCLLNFDSNHFERILGLYWNTETDMLTFRNTFRKINTELVNGSKLPTKREILKIVMTIFDPVGFLSPLVVKGRLIFQECWARKMNWDEVVPEDIYKKWRNWCCLLAYLDNLEIPRHYFKETPKEVELHVFGDASNKVYAAVAYYLAKFEDKFEISMISSKSKLGPLNKNTTIPRMELQAAVLAARLGKQISDESTYTITRRVWWSDSEIVLQWIRSESIKLKPYESYRVDEITQLTDVIDWRWIPSELNPADLATKESNDVDLATDSFWFQGPQFLKVGEAEWPKENKSKTDITIAKYINVIVEKDNCLPDVSRFSKWFRLIRTIAWIFRFLKNIQTKTRNQHELNPGEITFAEIVWWKKVQREKFSEDIIDLENGKKFNKKSKLVELSPFLDENGLLRMDSRIKYADICFDTKFPIILPSSKYDKSVELLIIHFHVMVNHVGQETVLNNLRQKYWILRSRQSVKTALRNCQVCRIEKSRPLQPEMAPLPQCRLKPFTRPFTYSGVDYFGPLLIKVKRSVEKRYGVLFTCFNTRAVHIEIAKTLNTDSALMAIQRFISRRGQPLELHSDNGTNFVGAENEMQNSLKEMNQTKMVAGLSKFKIKWVFNAPLAPNRGGVWERLIRSVKRVLYNTLKEQHPSEELLMTLLLEAERTVNSRPISHVSLDANGDEVGALTPMHFLIGSANTDNIPGVFKAGDIYGRKQWRVSQCLADRFWQRWIKEYLPNLQKRTKWFDKSQDITLGSIIAIPDESSRNHWRLGRITKLFPGPDSQIRTVEINTKNGKFVRSVNKLLFLEAGEC